MWTPLEGDSALFEEYLKALNINDVSVDDVYCFDPLAGMSNLNGVIVNYPLSFNVHLPSRQSTNPHIHFVKQDIENACGTVALLHLVRNTGLLLVGKPLKDYEGIHESFASKGSTEIDNDTEMHYIAIVLVDGEILWLDGRRHGVIVLSEHVDQSDFGLKLSRMIPEIFDITSGNGPDCLAAFAFSLLKL